MLFIVEGYFRSPSDHPPRPALGGSSLHETWRSLLERLRLQPNCGFLATPGRSVHAAYPALPASVRRADRGGGRPWSRTCWGSSFARCPSSSTPSGAALRHWLRTIALNRTKGLAFAGATSALTSSDADVEKCLEQLEEKYHSD